MTSSQLTDARTSLWNAIEHWTATSTWKRYKVETDPNKTLEMFPTGHQDIPAVKILPATIKFAWETQLYMQYDYVLNITVWMHTLPQIEAAMQDLWEAVIKCKPTGSNVPYTRAALEKPPEQLGVQFSLVGIGKENKLKAWSGVMTVGLITTNTPHS